MSTAIDLAHISKTYRSRAGVTHAIRDVSLRVEPGELFFLLGPSGCGKTTLLRIVAGFIEPSTGGVAFNSRDVTRTPPNKRNTGMVFQSYALWPHMSVAQNVAFGLGVRRVPAPERARRVREALDQVQMGEYADRRPTQLSGGQQQRVALARALVVRPDVLLLDEPLSNLDAKLRHDLRSQIRRVCKNAGLTTLYVTHDQKEALSMADRIAIMHAGDVAQLGEPGALYRAPSSRFVAEFLGEADFFSATILQQDQRGARVRCVLGEFGVDSPPPDSRDLLLAARPESWRLNAPDSHANRVQARLREVTFLGEQTQYTMEAEGTRLRVTHVGPPLSPAPARDQALTLSISPRDLFLVPGGTSDPSDKLAS